MGSKTNNMGTHKINEVANMKRKFHLMLLWNLTACWNFPISQLRESLPVGREVTRRWHPNNDFPLEEPVISLSSSEDLTGLQWRARVYETLLHFLSGKSHSSPVSLHVSHSAPPLLPSFGVSCLASLILPGTSILAFLGSLHLLISVQCVCVPHMTTQWLPPSSSLWLVIVRASSGTVTRKSHLIFYQSY